MNRGTVITLFDRFGSTLEALGVAPDRRWDVFDALPYASRRAAWDDLARFASTRGSAC